MSYTREAACAALFSAVSAAYAWNNTPARRLKLWPDVPPQSRPAFFQFEGAPEVYQWGNLITPRRTIEVKLFAYFAASDASPGATQINLALTAIDAALTPSGPDVITGRNTLGGACYDAKIKGVPFKEPGDLDGDALFVVEVQIVLP